VYEFKPDRSAFGIAVNLYKLFNNLVLKGHGFSHAAMEQENRGL
jgi:hypothetical protein